METNYVAFVKMAVDNMVKETDFPVVGKVLTDSRIATRKTLRNLERMGVLKSTQVSAGRGVMNAYYTEGAVPHVIRARRSNAGQPADASEVDN